MRAGADPRLRRLARWPSGAWGATPWAPAIRPNASAGCRPPSVGRLWTEDGELFASASPTRALSPVDATRRTASPGPPGLRPRPFPPCPFPPSSPVFPFPLLSPLLPSPPLLSPPLPTPPPPLPHIFVPTPSRLRPGSGAPRARRPRPIQVRGRRYKCVVGARGGPVTSSTRQSTSVARATAASGWARRIVDFAR